MGWGLCKAPRGRMIDIKIRNLRSSPDAGKLRPFYTDLKTPSLRQGGYV